jgi:4-hydroxyphenylpyruvate dioxygenase-like putative hemolysin
MFVEVKKTTTASNSRSISKIQQNFKKICKITHVDHLTYYVTDDQMDYWLQTKKTITLDQFINSEDGAI